MTMCTAVHVCIKLKNVHFPRSRAPRAARAGWLAASWRLTAQCYGAPA